MINLHQELVSALKDVLPTYYELQLTSKTKTPCISYMEINNYPITENNSSNASIGYSKITYQIKVWANNNGVLQDNALKVDAVLRPLGFKRISSGELYDNNSTMMQKILTYECIALENYN